MLNFPFKVLASLFSLISSANLKSIIYGEQKYL